MMRYLKVFILIGICLLAIMPISAQESTPSVPTDDEVRAMLDEARTALDEARTANDLAFNLLGLFEAFSVVLGVIAPLLGAIAAFFGFSQLSSARRELNKAREEFEEQIRESRQNFEDDMKKTVQVYFDNFNIQNDELRKKQDNVLQEALAKQQQLGTNANLALSLLPSAERQYRAQDYVGAIETYQRALELDSKNSIIHYRLGYVFTQKGDLEEAEKHIEQALELDPQSPQAKAALAYVYRRMGDKSQDPQQSDLYNKAERLFLDVLPKYEKLLDEDGESWWGAFGGLYKRREQYKLAIEKYEYAAQATKSSSYPYSNLAQLYMITGETEKMTKMYQRVERLAQAEVYAEVENYWAYADLITSRIAQGKFDEAWKVVDEALPTAPFDANYPLELLVNTLKDIQKYLPDYADKVTRFIDHIEQFLKNRKP